MWMLPPTSLFLASSAHTEAVMDRSVLRLSVCGQTRMNGFDVSRAMSVDLMSFPFPNGALCRKPLLAGVCRSVRARGRCEPLTWARAVHHQHTWGVLSVPLGGDLPSSMSGCAGTPHLDPTASLLSTRPRTKLPACSPFSCLVSCTYIS